MSAETDGDGFHLDEDAEGDDRAFRVSTIRLGAELYGDTNFETCVFWDGGSRVITRYETEADARSGHEAIIDAIEAGEYEFAPAELATFEVDADV